MLSFSIVAKRSERTKACLQHLRTASSTLAPTANGEFHTCRESKCHSKISMYHVFPDKASGTLSGGIVAVARKTGKWRD